MKTRTALIYVSILLPGGLCAAQSVAATQTGNVLCTANKFRELTAEYDPITDKTTAFVTAGLPTQSFLSPKIEAIVLQAQHATQTSDSVVSPRMWVALDMSLAETDVTLNILADDSVRYSWHSAPLQTPEFKSGYRYGLSSESVMLLFLAPPADEFARFARANHALIAINQRRYDLKPKHMLPFAEIERWSVCPGERRLAKPNK